MAINKPEKTVKGKRVAPTAPKGKPTLKPKKGAPRTAAPAKRGRPW